MIHFINCHWTICTKDSTELKLYFQYYFNRSLSDVLGRLLSKTVKDGGSLYHIVYICILIIGQMSRNVTKASWLGLFLWLMLTLNGFSLRAQNTILPFELIWTSPQEKSSNVWTWTSPDSKQTFLGLKVSPETKKGSNLGGQAIPSLPPYKSDGDLKPNP